MGKSRGIKFFDAAPGVSAAFRRAIREQTQAEVVQGLAEIQVIGLPTRWRVCVQCQERFWRVPTGHEDGLFQDRCLECHGTPAPTVNSQGRFILQTEGQTV